MQSFQLNVVKEKAAMHETGTKKDAFVTCFWCNVLFVQPVQSHIWNKTFHFASHVYTIGDWQTLRNFHYFNKLNLSSQSDCVLCAIEKFWLELKITSKLLIKLSISVQLDRIWIHTHRHTCKKYMILCNDLLQQYKNIIFTVFTFWTTPVSLHC